MKIMPRWVLAVVCTVTLVSCSDRSDQDEEADKGPAVASQSAPQFVSQHTGVIINGAELTSEQIGALTQLYRYAPPAGRYWYDTLSGAWGVEGREPAGFIQPGFDFGRVSADASGGNTGVFINGRQINMAEATALQRTYGAVYQGRWWLDGHTGNLGAEGNPTPLGNLLAAMQSGTSGGGAGGGGTGDNIWSSLTGAGNSSGGCSYVNLGNGTMPSSGCD